MRVKRFHVFDIIQREVEHLNIATKQAIWLQTEEGIDWENTIEEDEEQDEIAYCEDDIIEYILSEYVLSAAEDWTNKRIEKYISSREF